MSNNKICSYDVLYGLIKNNYNFLSYKIKTTDWPSSSPIFSCKLFWYIRRLFRAQHAASWVRGEKKKLSKNKSLNKPF